MHFRPYRQLYWEDVRVGQQVTPLEDFVSYHRIILGATTTGTSFAGHLDPEYARQQGQPTIYMATGGIQGLVNRVVTDWAGPMTMIRRRALRMANSIFADSWIHGTGVVTSTTVEGSAVWGGRLIAADVEIRIDDRLSVQSSMLVELPSHY